MGDLWNDLVTAESYAEHVDQWRIYRVLNQRLAEVACDGVGVHSEAQVLDLGCGTGATLEALLQFLPMGVDLLAVDAAQAMIDQARLRLPDPRITWRVERAEDLGLADQTRFDLITCGAAFWHFDPQVYDAVLSALKPSGRLVFNVPVAQCAGEQASRHPVQAALADLLARQRDQFPAVHPRFDRAEFERRCRSQGLLCEWTPQRWEGRQAALIDLLRIPSMAELVAPSMPRQALDELIEQAAQRVDGDQPVFVDWWIGRVEKLTP